MSAPHVEQAVHATKRSLIRHSLTAIVRGTYELLHDSTFVDASRELQTPFATRNIRKLTTTADIAREMEYVCANLSDGLNV